MPRKNLPVPFFKNPVFNNPVLIFFFLLTVSFTPTVDGATQSPPEQNAQLGLLDALVLGVVEGVTEYLPVSSTGHLLLTQHLMGLTDTPEKKASADAYAIVIQVGAILAVLGLYRRRVAWIVAGFFGKNPRGLHLGLMLVLAFIPAATAGLALEGWIKQYLFGPWPVALGWIAGGVAIFWVPGNPTEKNTAQSISIEDITWRIALIIGLFQVFALWPGISRSLATIVGGLAAGLGLIAAVEFSFLLGLITLGAATVYEFAGSGGNIIAAYGVWSPIMGILTALIAAWVSVKWLVAYLQRHGLRIFAYYRILLGVFTIILLLFQVL